MLDSDFWRDLAEKFRKLDPWGQYLWASWSPANGRTENSSWTVCGVGGDGERVKIEFDPLARRGGAKFEKPGDLLDAWLNAVKDHRRAEISLSRPTEDPDITEINGVHYPHLCITSSEVCRMLESKAIQAEHSIKTQNTQIGEEPGRRTVDTAIGGQDPIDVERTLLLDRYKQECRSVGVRVTDEMIAKAASPSWNDRTQVTWWKRNDPRSKPQADKAIRRVLSNKPHLP